jgi:hypothetical protein
MRQKSPTRKEELKPHSAPPKLGKSSKTSIKTPISPMKEYFVGLRPLTNYFDDLITGNNYIIVKDNSIFVGTLVHIYDGKTLNIENDETKYFLKSMNDPDILKAISDNDRYSYLHSNNGELNIQPPSIKDISTKEEEIKNIIDRMNNIKSSKESFLYNYNRRVHGFNYNRRVHGVNPQIKASINTVYENRYRNNGNRYRNNIEFHLLFMNVELISSYENAPSTPEFYITINNTNTRPTIERKGFFNNIYHIEDLVRVFENITKNNGTIPSDILMRIIGFFLHP